MMNGSTTEPPADVRGLITGASYASLATVLPAHRAAVGGRRGRAARGDDIAASPQGAQPGVPQHLNHQVPLTG